MEQRPDPDRLLRQVNEDRSEHQRGKLKIFFGYAAGVGKTYTMLEAAHSAKKAGVDVVVGYIEPHTRPETLALLDGLEQLPNLNLEYKNITLHEFNLDMAIERHPQLLLVDELAHTNAEGCRHIKRYQDIEELLNAGINVFTTVNVQHIESLNDIVASITGIIVRERIPDTVFDNADQVELVDIEPAELIERLNEGKVYKHNQAKKALQNFFSIDNLIALREIALRRTADRVNQIFEKKKQISQKSEIYTEEHILICLSPSPSNAKVIRTAARMANAFHGSFTALYVETPEAGSLTESSKNLLRDNLRLAEQLGARIVTVYGDDIASQIAEYARLAGVSKVVIGRSNTKKRFSLSKSSFNEKLTSLAPNLDIYIIPDITSKPYNPKHSKTQRLSFSLLDSVKSMLLLAATTLLGFWFKYLGFSEANIITVYILSVLCTALLTSNKVYCIVSSILSVIIFNFFFTEPFYTLKAYDSGYPVTFLIMFISAFITGTLTTRFKNQAKQSAKKAYRTEVLLETSQKLQRSDSREAIVRESANQLIKLLDKTVIFYCAENGGLSEPVIFDKNSSSDNSAYINSDEQAVAWWVYKNNKHAGATTNTLPGAKCLYLAVRSNDAVFAVVGIALGKDTLEVYDKGLLISMLGECALALEKNQISDTKNEIAIKAQQERLRANLLRAISHDLRTPLTSISGNAGVLLGNSDSLDEAKKLKLYNDIYDDSIWLINLVENILSVTRIEDGTMNIHMDAELIYEVIAEALRHIDRRSSEHNIKVDISDDLLMAKMDSRLIIQVIINIVDNAIKYTPKGSTIVISAKKQGGFVNVEIADDGEGIPDSSKGKLFDMFYTVDNNNVNKVADSRRGLGLGLSLCKSIVQAHGGQISVRDNVPHGTVFSFSLVVEEVTINE